MDDWKELNNNQYFCRGFSIEYAMVIIDRRAVDYMRATKEVTDEQGETKKISFKTTGDSFEEVKSSICGKIEDYFKSLESSVN